MEKKKYVLTDETMEIDGHILHRIESVNTSWAKKGGWVESENNLSQEGECWIGCEAKVYGDARVINNAMVYGDARVYGNAMVMENAYVYDGAMVYGKAVVCGYARVKGNARLYGNTKITGNTVITENADVSGSLVICDDAYICRDVVIRSKNDYLFIRNNFSSCRGITWTKSNDMYRTGCFYGTAEELIAKAEQDDERAATSAYLYNTYCKADYFRAIVAMVETFKKINEKDDEIKKRLKKFSK